MTHSTTTFSITTLSTMTFSIITLSTMTFSITVRKHDTDYYTQHYDD